MTGPLEMESPFCEGVDQKKFQCIHSFSSSSDGDVRAGAGRRGGRAQTPTGAMETPLRPYPLIGNVVPVDVCSALPLPSLPPPDLAPASAGGDEAAVDAETVASAAALLARVDMQYL